jgi:hypothetical protein
VLPALPVNRSRDIHSTFACEARFRRKTLWLIGADLHKEMVQSRSSSEAAKSPQYASVKYKNNIFLG